MPVDADGAASVELYDRFATSSTAILIRHGATYTETEQLFWYVRKMIRLGNQWGDCVQNKPAHSPNRRESVSWIPTLLDIEGVPYWISNVWVGAERALFETGELGFGSEN